MSDSLDDELMPFSIDYRSIVGYLQLQLRSNNKTADSAPGLATWEVTLTRDAENARHELAGHENAAPCCRGGKCET